MTKPPLPDRRRFTSHRSHTAKLLPKAHTSYPLLVLVLLMVGVLLGTTTLQVKAATTGSVNVTVLARANGPAPIQAAQILSPVNDQRFSDDTIPVSGTCEPGYFVKLFRNEIFSGAVACSPTGTFVVTTSLFAGRNDLQARSYNLADQEGPRSNIVTVYYDPPIDPPVDPTNPDPDPGDGAPPPRPGGLPTPSSPFYIRTEYFFKAAYTGQTTKWNFEVLGGTVPYTARIVWGDGYSDKFQGFSNQSFDARHIYKSIREEREYFTVMVHVTDANGRTASLQLIAIMNDKDLIGSAQSAPDAPFSGLYTNWLLSKLTYVWSAYGLVLLMGVCFWLGERRGESVMAGIYRKRHRKA